MSEVDIQSVVAALGDPFLTQGPRVEEFEERLADAVGARYAVVFSSGTAALHGAYFSAGVRPGRRVLTSPLTFVATANASLYLGGGVRFADVDPETALLDPQEVAATASSDVRVVTPVHLCGHVADMEALAELADERGWVLIEDAAHALGASYESRDGSVHNVGACAHSSMCCMSFHPVKHITTGEGGAVTTNSEDYYHGLRRFRTHGITRNRSEMVADDGPWYYEQVELGFNYRITDFQCALGISQLARLDEFLSARRRIAEEYDRCFAENASIRSVRPRLGVTSAYHLYVVRIPASIRRRVFESLRGSGIGVNVHYIPVYRHPYYREHGFATVSLPNAEAYYAEAVTLPIYPDLPLDKVRRIVAVVQEVMDAASG